MSPRDMGTRDGHGDTPPSCPQGPQSPLLTWGHGGGGRTWGHGTDMGTPRLHVPKGRRCPLGDMGTWGGGHGMDRHGDISRRHVLWGHGDMGWTGAPRLHVPKGHRCPLGVMGTREGHGDTSRCHVHGDGTDRGTRDRQGDTMTPCHHGPPVSLGDMGTWDGREDTPTSCPRGPPWGHRGTWGHLRPCPRGFLTSVGAAMGTKGDMGTSGILVPDGCGDTVPWGHPGSMSPGAPHVLGGHGGVVHLCPQGSSNVPTGYGDTECRGAVLDPCPQRSSAVPGGHGAIPDLRPQGSSVVPGGCGDTE